MNRIHQTLAALALSLAVAPACMTENDEPEQFEPETGEAVNPTTADQALSMPPCGTPLQWFDGTAAYSNGPNTGTGVSCAGQGGVANGLQYQCVELVMRHFKTKWGLRWYGNAKDLLRNAPRDSVDVYDNGDAAHPPVPGDMLVWADGQWGHVALVTAVRSNAIDVIEQNVGGTNGKWTIAYSNGRVASRWGGWPPQGWAHAKANTRSAPPATARHVRSDVNGDGRADLVSLHHGGSAYVWPGRSDGKFGGAKASFSGTMNDGLFDGVGHVVIDVADVDGDGRSDLVTAHNNGEVYVYKGATDGSFGGRVSSFSGTFDLAIIDRAGHEPIAVADVDGDGRGDLVTVHSDGNVYVYPGKVGGTFGGYVRSFGGTMRSRVLKGSGHWIVDAADVTGDGKADLVTVHDNGNAYVYPGRADGSFGGYVSSFAGTLDSAMGDGAGHEIVGVGDVNGDGRADLVTQRGGTAYVFRGTASGSFAAYVASFRGTLASSAFGAQGHELIGVLDVTGDGKADLVSSGADGSAYVWPGSTDGSFAAAVSSFNGTLESAQFDGDGHQLVSEKKWLRRVGCNADGCR